MVELKPSTLRTGISHTFPVIPLNAGNCLFVLFLINNSYRESHWISPPPIVRRNKMAVSVDHSSNHNQDQILLNTRSDCYDFSAIVVINNIVFGELWQVVLNQPIIY